MPHVTALFSRSHRPGSPIIRAADRWGQWSHCGLLMPDTTVIEARAFYGVVRNPAEDFTGRATKWAARNIEVPNPEAAYAWIARQVGKGYDYGAVLANLLREDGQSPERFDCSELVESAILAGGRERFRCALWKLSPNQIFMVN